MRQMLTGRPASWLKEAVEHYVSLAVRAERTVPGIYHWSPEPPSSEGTPQPDPAVARE